MHYQKAFFDQIILRSTDQRQLANQISILLNIRRDSVYRRMQGKTLLTIAEMIQLAEYFKISLDEVFLPQNNIIRCLSTINSTRSIANLLDYWEGEFNQYETNLSCRLYFNSKQIPFFYLFVSPILAAFQIYLWKKETMIINPDTIFQFNTFHPDLIDQTQRISQRYLQLQRTEYWTLESLNNILQQIKITWLSGKFKDKTDGENLLVELQVILEQIQDSCIQDHFSSYTRAEPSLELYHCTKYTSSKLYLDSESESFTYIPLDDPHVMKSSDTNLSTYTRYWFQYLERHSTSLSQIAERDRVMFFHCLRDKVEQILMEIKS